MRRKHTATQPDLQGLEITKGELKHLSGLSIDSVIRPFKLRRILHEVSKSILIGGLLALSCLILIGDSAAEAGCTCTVVCTIW